VGRACANISTAWPLRACAVMGRAGRRGPATSAPGGPRIAYADGAFMEPARSRVGGPEARSLRARGTRLHRLGCASARRRGATADCRTVMGGSWCASAIEVAVAGME
jgi:hypothetical protein